MKLATSATYQGIERLIKQYYKYNNVCIVNLETGTISNAKGVICGVRVYQKKNRFIFETI